MSPKLYTPIKAVLKATYSRLGASGKALSASISMKI